MNGYNAIKSNIQPLILKLLSKNPAHGYQVIREIRRKYHVLLGPSTVYPLLRLLEDQELIESEWILNTKRPRKVYKLTSKGETYFDNTKLNFTILANELSSEEIKI